MSQGQTLKNISIDLTNPCFSHSMFYVVVSRTGASKNLHFSQSKQEMLFTLKFFIRTKYEIYFHVLC